MGELQAGPSDSRVKGQRGLEDEKPGLRAFLYKRTTRPVTVEGEALYEEVISYFFS
jgi:hypothetical protein